ncbi:phage recombination protein Bet [Bartonella raoultii]|uniref:Phage recombination protein Bet n=1 Tax=Bartonella raoultii TaxID=1457020 RepID=A0ABS7I8J7_9HYPH|nr:phage recombination protein Bet [Bartonella raoultii]MBX4335575.1 phage recombination protein Bet [Bartonella raoultii]MBX4335662.1 phage recombination protein Bet [Bartonella raoultii]MBX4336040.1 phage recombination protein Bet [Bartonella raoultii]MBX4336367.1 phage recombination protein Bet [Bartonella raoultii]MBX4336551.1 phage recombination protein Bet [Bartonella raoultii]
MTNSPLTTMASKYGFSHEQFRKTIIKTCINYNFSDEEFAAFISVANTYGLNPLTKEIYALPKRGGGIIPVVSIDGWIKIIKSNPQFDGMTFQDQLDKEGNIIAIKCAIRLKNIKDPIEVTEYLAECKQKTDTWQKYPARMLRHKATIQCARYAFGFSGIYEEDEAARINEVNQNIQDKMVSYETLMQIKQLMDSTQTEENKILTYAKANTLADISDGQAQTILHLLKEKQQKQRIEAQHSLPTKEQIEMPVQEAEYIHIQDIEYEQTQQQTAV